MPAQYFVLPGGLVFTDKKIPIQFDKPIQYGTNDLFTSEYFVNLHNAVTSFGNYTVLVARNLNIVL